MQLLARACRTVVSCYAPEDRYARSPAIRPAPGWGALLSWAPLLPWYPGAWFSLFTGVCPHPSAPSQGVAIVANKFKHVYAAVVRDVDDAVNARSAYHCNVLCLGARVTTLADAKE